MDIGSLICNVGAGGGAPAGAPAAGAAAAADAPGKYSHILSLYLSIVHVSSGGSFDSI